MEYREFSKKPFSEEELKFLGGKVDGRIGSLLNPKGRNVKSDGLNVEEITEEEAVLAIGLNPKYLYRPMIVRENGELIRGYSKKIYEEIF